MAGSFMGRRLTQAEANKMFGREETLGSNNDGSNYKVPSSSKTNKKEAVNPPPEEINEVRISALNEGVLRHPKVPDQSVTPADFYRRGKIRPPTAEEEETGDTSVKYDQMPRFIEEIPEDEPASIRLIGKPTKKSKSKETDLIPPFSKFFLSNVSEAHNERSQIVETFGDFYVFFFGERPPVYNFSGTLLNTNKINWAQDFMFYYDNFLRGTKCVEFNAKIVLTYGYSQIEGFILGTSMNKDAVNPNGAGLTFQVLVIDRKVMKLSMDFGLIEADGKFNQDKNIMSMITKGSSVPYVSKANNNAKDVANKKKPSASSEKAKSSQIASFEKEYGFKFDTTNTSGLKMLPSGQALS